MTMRYRAPLPAKTRCPSTSFAPRGNRPTILAVVLLACMIALGTAPLPCQAGGPLKVAFLYNSPVGDGGWNHAHELARLKLGHAFPSVKTLALASVSREDAPDVMENLIRQGVRALFATDAGFSAAAARLAGQHPEVMFFVCGGRYRAPNVISYGGKIHQPAYLSGILAASMSVRQRLGFLGEAADPAAVRALNAFVLGARSVRPAIAVEAAWCDGPPEQAARLVRKFSGNGVDVYFNGIRHASPMQVAMDHGMFAIGYATDLSRYASERLLTSAIYDWSVFYAEAIRALQAGTLPPGSRYQGLETGVTALGTISPLVPVKVVQQVKAREKALKEGRLQVFSGPIHDASGQLRVARGTSASETQLDVMDWLLPGIRIIAPTRLESSDRIRVFIVQSYGNDDVCGIPQEIGIREVLRHRFGKRLDVRVHYMNTKTVNSSPGRMRTEAARVLKKIRAFAPQLVFTLDDNAFREVGLQLVGQPFPVVFSGLNGQPRDYHRAVPFLDRQGLPVRNVTGVYEKLHLQAALNVMREAMPDLRHVVALLDRTPTGQAIRKQLQIEMRGAANGIRLSIRSVATMQEYLREIHAINASPEVQAVYPLVLSIKNKNNQSIGPHETLRTYLRHCRKPGIPLNFSFAQLGLFGGASVDFAAMGQQAGNMGVKLLQHHDIRTLPIESAERSVITFNTRRAAMLGIEIPHTLLTSAELYTSMPLLKTSGSASAGAKGTPCKK